MDRGTADRDAFLRKACGGDEGLRREVESLLGSERAADSSSAMLTRRQTAPYQICALLGAGGMGEVYRARDTMLNRDVALNVLNRNGYRRCRA